MRSAAVAILILALLAGAAGAATYHVDAIGGDDALGNASAASPWRTLARVRPLLRGGDTVILYDGDYGSIEEVRSGVTDLYDDWVTYQAADGASPSIEHVYFGWNSGSYTGPNDQTGAYDVYLRLQGLHIRDGLSSYGARHWALVDCLVERYGPWTGSADNIEKTAVAWRCGTDILIQGCEITNTGTGIAGRGHDIRIIGNHIHGGKHDGIRVTGFWDSLIEGNRIHDFDDGVTDAEAPDWSRHCDLIHIFIPGPGFAGWQNHNVIFRNNVLYDAEAQIVQFNNYYASSIRNEMIVFENNVFGPGNAPMFNNADPCDALVFRNNTVVYTPGGRVYHRWTCNNFSLRISDESTDVEIYNNILGGTGIEVGADVHVFDWNLIQQPGNPVGVDNSRAYGRFTLIGADPRFLDAANMDYRFAADSPAVNAGTCLFAPDPLYEWDYEGTARDRLCDLGAYEFPGLSPDPETPLVEFPGKKTVFVDDFEDGHYADADPWLAAAGQQGLSWRQTGLADKFYVTNSSTQLSRNSLYEPTGSTAVQRVSWILSDQGDDWVDYTFEFAAWNSYLVTGGGPVLLVRDTQNCYWLDIARDSGRLVRYLTDAAGRPASTTLATSTAIRLPHYGARNYRITVTHDTTGILIQVDADANGSIDLSFRDTDPRARAVFTSGGIGFHGDVMDMYHKIHYDDVTVTVAATVPEPLPPLAISAWEVIESHGSAGEVVIPAAEGFVASGLDGLRKVRVTFTGPLDPATVTNGSVSILGTLNGSLSGLISDLSLGAGHTEMTILLSAPLPDGDRFVFTIANSLAGAQGSLLSGNRDRLLATLAGDVNGTGQVAASDVVLVREKVGLPVTAATARYDLDGSGTITAVDMLAVRALRGHSLP